MLTSHLPTVAVLALVGVLSLTFATVFCWSLTGYLWKHELGGVVSQERTAIMVAIWAFGLAPLVWWGLLFAGLMGKL